MRRWALSCAAILLVIGASLYLYSASKDWGMEGVPKTTATDCKISALSAAISSYQMNSGGFAPTEKQGLKALVRTPTDPPLPERWFKLAEGYDLLDSWKTPFAYHSPARKGGGEFEIVSAGPDKKMNTDDDISSVKPE